MAAVKKDAAGLFQFYPVQADHLNTPRMILNSANTPVWRWDATDAFGTVQPNGDPDGDGSLFEYNLRFPGQFYDKETGLHYNYFRDYDPVTGRYIDSDPIGLAGGLNTYGYVGGNPINYVDPLGLARFGYRPLGSGNESFDSKNIPNGNSNTEYAHEQLWFDDISSDNTGFFAGDGSGNGPAICGENGKVRSDDGHSRYQYSFFGPTYDDARMRKAVENVTPSWNNQTYCVVGANCQDFADALRQEYNKLSQPHGATGGW